MSHVGTSSAAPIRVRSGHLVLLVGPSGAGKDTMLHRLETTLPLEADVAIARRYITRPLDNSGERHIPVTPAAFAALQASGAFVLDWTSHGLRYGIGREILAWMHAGMCVVANGSRAHVKEARAKFEDRVLVVLVTASTEVLAARLIARKRESGDAIAARLARTAEIADDVEPDLVIHNDGDVAEAVSNLRNFLLQSVVPCA